MRARHLLSKDACKSAARVQERSQLIVSSRDEPRSVAAMCVAIQIVRPLESIAETQPQLQPASLRLSAMISQYFTRRILLVSDRLQNGALYPQKLNVYLRAVIRYLMLDGVRSLIGRQSTDFCRGIRCTRMAR